jgi:hypothetical protein
MDKINGIQYYLLIFLLPIVLITQATWIFRDAQKRGENKWLWGLLGLLNVPTNLIIYLLVTRKFIKTKVCQSCKKRIRAGFKFCPHCGDKQDG